MTTEEFWFIVNNQKKWEELYKEQKENKRQKYLKRCREYVKNRQN